MNDQQQPRDVQAEERLIASMMADAASADEALGVVRSSDFTAVARQFVFEAMRELRGRDAPGDLTLIYDELRKRGHEERVGGPLELARVSELVPSGASVRHYAEIVARMGRRRRIMLACERLHRRAADLTVPDDELQYVESIDEEEL